ncbi:MAG: Protein of unknown function (DUF2812) [Methanobacterium sp. Maddingley MBC34]|nr:MAG: Protein of unknown function (DUF2812) [Methanobacterium sp. Maddingley MBC34]
MKEVKTVWRMWGGWEIEKIENWMEEMEKNGWSLFKFDFTMMRFQFKKDESRKTRYCFDYQSNVGEDYFEIFKEDNWELVDETISPWYVWRKSYEDKKPCIYTDTRSLIERNNRQIRNIGFGAIISLILLSSVLITGFDNTKLISAILIVLIVFFGYLIAQLYQYNKKLKNNAIKC